MLTTQLLMLLNLVISRHPCFTLHATWHSPEHLLGVSDSLELVCSGSEDWSEVEPSAEDQVYLSEQAI